MGKMKPELFRMFCDVESATASIDDIIRILHHAYESYNLGNTSLSEMEQFDLLNRYRSLGSIILVATEALENIVKEIEDIGEKYRTDSDDRDQVIG